MESHVGVGRAAQPLELEQLVSCRAAHRLVCFFCATPPTQFPSPHVPTTLPAFQPCLPMFFWGAGSPLFLSPPPISLFACLPNIYLLPRGKLMPFRAAIGAWKAAPPTGSPSSCWTSNFPCSWCRLLLHWPLGPGLLVPGSLGYYLSLFGFCHVPFSLSMPSLSLCYICVCASPLLPSFFLRLAQVFFLLVVSFTLPCRCFGAVCVCVCACVGAAKTHNCLSSWLMGMH